MSNIQPENPVWSGKSWGKDSKFFDLCPPNLIKNFI